MEKYTHRPIQGSHGLTAIFPILEIAFPRFSDDCNLKHKLIYFLREIDELLRFHFHCY